MIIRDKVKIAVDIICNKNLESICVRMIDRIAANNDKIVEETIDTNVSSATCFSILLWLSILLIIIAANPNKTVNTTEKTVVKRFAKASSTENSNL